MGSRCSICNHSRLADIDASLELAWSLRAIEARFKGTSRSSLGRHNQHRRPVVIDYREDILEQLVGMVRESMRREVLPELDRLRAALTPRTTLRRALELFGLRCPGERMVMVDRMLKALVEEECWKEAKALLIIAGHDIETARETVETVAAGQGQDPELVGLELLWAKPPIQKGGNDG